MKVITIRLLVVPFFGASMLALLLSLPSRGLLAQATQNNCAGQPTGSCAGKFCASGTCKTDDATNACNCQ